MDGLGGPSAFLKSANVQSVVIHESHDGAHYR